MQLVHQFPAAAVRHQDVRILRNRNRTFAGEFNWFLDAHFILPRLHPVAADSGNTPRTRLRSKPSSRRADVPACISPPNAGHSCGFFRPCKTRPAPALRRFLDTLVGQAEFFRRVERRVFVAQAKAALRNFADAAPFARHDLKNLFDQFLRRLVALAPDGTAY